MSLDCRIIDNKVLAPNNEPSILFNSLEQKYGREKALDFYALTETEEYQVTLDETDSNGEMLLDNFLKFVFNKPSNKNFTQETLEIQHRVGAKGIKRLKDSLFQNGVVTINENTLSSSGVFTSDEVQYILDSEETIQNLEEFVKNAEPLEVSPISDTYLVLDSGYNELGIKPYKDPSQVKKEILETTSQAQTVEEVYSLINTIEYPTIIKQFKENPIIRTQIIEDSLNSQEVDRVYEEDYIEQTILNTFDVTQLSVIEQISDNILALTDKDLITDEFLNLVDSLRASGLDINIDTYQAYNTDIQNIKSIARELISFSKRPDANNIKNLANSLETVMNLSQSEIINRQNISDKVGRVVYLETDKNELEVFDERGFIRHSENIYQEVDDRYNTEQLYEILYGKVLNGSLSIPLPSLENSEQIAEPINKPTVIKDIKDFIKKETSKLPYGDTNLQEKVAIYKTYYGAPQKIQQRQPTVGEIQNEEYLKTDFVSDFSKFINFNKDRQTSLYKNLLKFFRVDKNGITLTDNNKYTLDHIKNNLSLLDNRIENDLISYSFLSKKLDLQIDNRISDNINTLRAEVTENPYSLEELNKNYSNITQSDIVVENSDKQFIRVKDSAYEKTQEIGNVSLYSKLPTPNSLYKNTNITRPDPLLSYEDFKSYTQQENKGQTNLLIGDIQLEEINENHFNCE